MVKATPAPSVKATKWLGVPYLYAAMLIVMAVVELMGVSGFEFAHIKYQTPGSPAMIIVVAGLQIFSLPFLLRLRLSPLARFFSALFAAITPYFILAYAGYLIAEQDVPADWFSLTCVFLLVPLGGIGFAILGGQAALRFSKK